MTKKSSLANFPRIGLTILAPDPFWVEVQEGIQKAAKQIGLDLVLLHVDPRFDLSLDEQAVAYDEIRSQDVEGILDYGLPDELLNRLLRDGYPVVSLVERTIRHPNLVCPEGLEQGARILGEYVKSKLTLPAKIMLIRGDHAYESRLQGLHSVLTQREISIVEVAAFWELAKARDKISECSFETGTPFRALIGLSDSLAMMGREIGLQKGWLSPDALICGINGDPLALAAIAEGYMMATVETSATDFGEAAVRSLYQILRGQSQFVPLSYQPHLVTAENVGKVALKKLVRIADIPTRLVGVNRQQEQQRLEQLELSQKIGREVGTILDRHQLLKTITELFKKFLGFDQVIYYAWNSIENTLIQEVGAETQNILPLNQSELFSRMFDEDRPIFIPDVKNSVRFYPDVQFPKTASRVVVPIHIGGGITGALDLHSNKIRPYSQQEILGFQSLADQLGITLSNAELYSRTKKAQERAEQADALKTRLLANVSHELRTPLGLILGYSQSLLSKPNPYLVDLPEGLLKDVGYIYQSGEHLLRIINDLLDLSRAEVNMLDLSLQIIDTKSFLKDVFESFRKGLTIHKDIGWNLEMPVELPAIQADPGRLRQIIFNLLSNAFKFTKIGSIAFGAEVQPPFLHFWVKDSGIGIPLELQEKIFDPFVSLSRNVNTEGIGLGLSITRRLVALHFGSMSLESKPDQGSIFHVYLPLPSLDGRAIKGIGTKPTIAFLSQEEKIPPHIMRLGVAHQLDVQLVKSRDDFDGLLATGLPSVLAWQVDSDHYSDWSLVEYVRSRPDLMQLPFLLYAKSSSMQESVPSSVTSVLIKPVPIQSLLQMIEALRPAETRGPILVVDDDEKARTFYSSVLFSAFPSKSILCFENGSLAIKAIRQEMPSLVILDLMMPVMNGFEVLKQLRAIEGGARVPVLVLSGKVLSQEDLLALDDAYLTYQSKGIMTEDEIREQFQRVFAGTGKLPQFTSSLVKGAIAYFQQNYQNTISRDKISQFLGVSPDYLTHIFSQEIGISPWEFLTRYRIYHACELLRNTTKPVTQIALSVGYNDSNYFSRAFQKQIGCSPKEYRNRST